MQHVDVQYQTAVAQAMGTAISSKANSVLLPGEQSFMIRPIYAG